MKQLTIAAGMAISALWPSLSSADNNPYDYFTGSYQSFKQTSGKVMASYVANWADPNAVDNINGNNLTHILYAFLNGCGPGETDRAKALCTHKQDYELAETPTSIDKTFAAKFSALKSAYPHIKILPSVGGWGGSGTFAPMTKTKANRAVFINDVVNYLKANPVFDGIDIDWEWPGTPQEGEQYADLMHELRSAFEVLGSETGREYQITSAIGSHKNNVANINYARAQEFMDYIFIMTYDFFGGWSKQNIGHHTALQAHSANGNNAHGGAEGVKNLLDAGVPASKLVLGVAMYARGWDGVSPNSTGSLLGGTATSGFPKKVNTWDEEGVATYKRLVAEIIGSEGQGINGFTVTYNAECDCHYAYRDSDSALVTFDHPKDVANKAQYALEHGLAGVFSWEYNQDNGDILSAMNFGLGNTLLVPDNSGNCAGVPHWRADVIYNHEQVQHNNVLYQSYWWNKGRNPAENSGEWQAWAKIADCDTDGQ
ncbi:glycosyl hydrolase family 18 protein [Thalassomonas sp. RHCl1]|uniref:glycosyl hydrolase family 18 protein n=1 Tax=Thalassomonas sp. RHCl1 TaxID=2995320 RepID=UPI00248BC66B|nr:glycosyl hydrolase family 18 protein [Thalassomonas sp. RHCl1]